MRKYIIVLSAIICNTLNAQTTTVITFSEKIVIKRTDLKQVPEGLKDFMLAKLNAEVSENTLSFDSKNNYFRDALIKNEKLIPGEVARVKNGFYRDVNIKKSGAGTKIIKNILKNSIAEDNDRNTVSVASALWKRTVETKKILNYNCKKAVTTFKDSPLTIYYTKEIPGRASPKDFPFIDGVILEHQYKQKSGIATKVEFNQPDIKDFFK